MSNADVPLAMRPGQKWDANVMQLNTEAVQLQRNIRHSIRRHLPQVSIHPESPQVIALVGGGWSLEDTYDELRRLHFEEGVKLVALNGAAKWLAERNLRPS